MIELNLGDGFAPCVGFWDGLLHCAWGSKTHKLQLATFTLAGVEVQRQTFEDGHFSSFPRIDGPWLVYKAYPTLSPVAVHLVSGARQSFDFSADGNWPVAVHGALGMIAWQTAPNWQITLGEFNYGSHYVSGQVGAPSGLDYIRPDLRVILRDEIMNAAPHIGGFVQRAMDLQAGQYGYGVGLRLDGWEEAEPTRWLWGGTEATDPRIAGSLDLTHYAVTAWGKQGVRLAILSRAELHALPSIPGAEQPPDPEPEPIPDPPEKKTMMLPANVHATFVACVNKFPHTGGDDERRAAMEKAVQTIRARHGLRYVWKTEHANLTAPSKDALGYVPEGVVRHGVKMPMYIWDMINGTTREPQDAHESEPLREAYVLAVEPKDWLAEVQPEPEPEPEPEPDALEPRVTAVELALARIHARLSVLENRPEPKPSLSDEQVRDIVAVELAKLSLRAELDDVYTVPFRRHTHGLRVTLTRD